jgi:hypothetical protein
MQLRTVDGKLSLGSVYKIVVWGWLIGWSIFLIPIFFLIAIGTLISGQMSWNGETIYGRGAIFMRLLPFVFLPPIVIILHAFIFGGVITLGVLIYRRFRPLTVAAE